MGKNAIAYGLILYVVGMILWNAAFTLPAVWASQGQMGLAAPFYAAFSFTCHQLDHRSLCYYPEGEQIIADCKPKDANDFAHRNIEIEDSAFGTGYKLAVCSRDTAIYFAMFLGAIAWIIVYRKNLARDVWPHPRWLILSMVPIALDGGTQILGLRESTNELRIITGAIVGFAVSFYLIPAMNQIFNSIISDIFGIFAKKG